jgi:ATP-dependent Clp protease ATP-binding subunit ClpA
VRERLEGFLRERFDIKTTALSNIENAAEPGLALRNLSQYFQHHLGLLIVQDADVLARTERHGAIAEGLLYFMNQVRSGSRHKPVIFIGRSHSLPPLLANHPFLEQIPVERPSSAELQRFFFELMDSFSGAEDVGDSQALDLAERLADAMRARTLRECRALVAYSARKDLSVTEPEKLVSEFLGLSEEYSWSRVGARNVANAVTSLSERIAGQPAALDAVAQGLRNSVVNVSFDESTAATNRPRAVFLFAGTTGVGKTEMAKALTSFVFGREDALLRFDMGEFRSEASFTRLIGSSPGYVGFDRGGELTEAVRSRPQSVVLFDEFEKADPSILDVFLAIVDDGRCTDGRGQTVDFSETIVIFTSNLGVSSLPSNLQELSYEELQMHLTGEIERDFRFRLGRPELFGRLRGGLVIFDLLRGDAVPDLCAILMSRLAENVQSRFDTRLLYDEGQISRGVLGAMRESDWRYGGRAIRSLLERRVMAPLVDGIMAADSAVAAGIRINWEADEVVVRVGP